MLAAASITVEELYLAQKLGRALGTPHIDHRLGQTDFETQDSAPVMPWLGMQMADLETLDAALLIGSNIRKDQPIAAVRLRKSALKGGAVSFINPRRFPLHFDAAEEIVSRHDHMVGELLCVARAAGADLAGLADVPETECNERHQRVADALKSGERSAVMLGNIAVQHPAYSQLRFLATRLAKATGATLSLLPERANTAGAWLAGVVPHRQAGGKPADTVGMDAAAMLAKPCERYLLVGAELEFDAADPTAAISALQQASGVVSISAFLSDSLRAHADVVLPAATFTETFGTYVNAAGVWQTSKGAVPTPGEARPMWKIIRVLADSLALDGFGYDSPESITRELQEHCGDVELNNMASFDGSLSFSPPVDDAMLRSGEAPIYTTDPLVRRSVPLQKSYDGQQAFASLSPAEFARLELGENARVSVSQNGHAITLPVRLDEGLPDGCVWIPSGLSETSALGSLFAPIEVSRA